MTQRLTLLASILLFGALGVPAPAQTAAAPDAAAPDAPAGSLTAPAATGPDALSLGEPVDSAEGPGSTYIAETFGEWEQRCVRGAEGESDRCQLYQLLHDEAGNPVAEITVFGLEPGQVATAGATIVTPLETLLTQQVTLKVDDGTAKRYPFTWCSDIGCFARIGFTADEVDAFRAGSAATITIVPVRAPDQTVPLSMSLIGFTAGFAAVNAANGL